MSYTKIIEIPIFDHTLQVIFGNKDEVKTILIEAYNIELSDAEDLSDLLCPKNTTGTFLYSEKYDDYYLWLPRIPETIDDYGTMVHELQHFVFMFLDNRGFVHSNDSDEMYSYLIGYVFKELESYIEDIKNNDNENK